MDEPVTSEGTIPFRVPSTGDESVTYYKTFGDLKHGRRPLVVLHGGPGAGHGYCLPFAKLWTLFQIPIIFYDQIGCAASTHFREKVNDGTFWHPDLFIAELKNVIAFFHLDRPDGPGYDLLGHSWGSVLGNYFASQRPPGLRRLILASGTSSGENMAKGLWEKLRTLSPEVQQAVERAIEKDDFTDPSYLAAAAEFMSTFLCRASPTPPEMQNTNKNMADDITVRLTFQGRSPWLYDGLARQWSSIKHSAHIAVPTLMITGEFDTSPDWVYEPLFELIPKIRWVTIPGAGHMYFLETPERQARVFGLINSFLQETN